MHLGPQGGGQLLPPRGAARSRGRLARVGAWRDFRAALRVLPRQGRGGTRLRRTAAVRVESAEGGQEQGRLPAAGGHRPPTRARAAIRAVHCPHRRTAATTQRPNYQVFY